MSLLDIPTDVLVRVFTFATVHELLVLRAMARPLWG